MFPLMTRHFPVYTYFLVHISGSADVHVVPPGEAYPLFFSTTRRPKEDFSFRKGGNGSALVLCLCILCACVLKSDPLYRWFFLRLSPFLARPE